MKVIGVLCLAFAVASAAPSGVQLGVVAHSAPVVLETVGPLGVGSISQGPGSKTVVAGPDGSVITSAAEGGAVASDSVNAKVVAPATSAVVQGPVETIPIETVPVVQETVVAEPVVAARTVIAADPVVQVAHSVPVAESTVVAGPSGTIAVTKNAVAPVVARTVVAPSLVTGPVLATGAGVVAARSAAVVSHGLLATPQIVGVGAPWAGHVSAPVVYAQGW